MAVQYPTTSYVYIIRLKSNPNIVIDLIQGNVNGGGLQFYHEVPNENQKWGMLLEDDVDHIYTIESSIGSGNVIEWHDEGPAANETVVALRSPSLDNRQRFRLINFSGSGDNSFVIHPEAGIQNAGLSYAGATLHESLPVVNQADLRIGNPSGPLPDPKFFWTFELTSPSPDLKNLVTECAEPNNV
jgi:hypothetical protein